MKFKVIKLDKDEKETVPLSAEEAIKYIKYHSK